MDGNTLHEVLIVVLPELAEAKSVLGCPEYGSMLTDICQKHVEERVGA